MPTSHISEEAEQAGEQFEIKQGKSIKPKKRLTPKKAPAVKPQRRRGRKLSFDPAKGFPIPAKAAEQLVKRGFIKRQDTVKQDTSLGSQVSQAAASGLGAQQGDALQGQYPTPGPQVNFIYSKRSVSSFIIINIL